MNRKSLKLISVVLSAVMVLCALPFCAFADDICEHEAAEAVRENELLPTCTTSGYYDEVVYCEKCGEKLSSTHVSVQLTGHKDEDGDNVCDECNMELTSLTTGETENDKCPLCGITGHSGNKNEGLGMITAEGGLICWMYRIVTFILKGAEFGQDVSVFKWFTIPTDFI